MGQFAEAEMGRCIHFTGLIREVCEAGVRYRDVRDESKRPYGFPCLKRTEATTTCDRCQFPTAEEAAAAERKMLDALARVGVARAAIVEATGGRRGVSGTIPCPCCEAGTLRYSVAGSNGHIHAHCSTDGCAGWME